MGCLSIHLKDVEVPQDPLITTLWANLFIYWQVCVGTREITRYLMAMTLTGLHPSK